MVSRMGVRTSGGALSEPEASDSNLSQPFRREISAQTPPAPTGVLAPSARIPHGLVQRIPPSLHAQTTCGQPATTTAPWPNQTSLLSSLMRSEPLPSLSFPENSPSDLEGHAEFLHFL